MAEKKYNWTIIKRDYMNDKYKTVKELGEAYGIPYTYIKKRSAKWHKEKKIIEQMNLADTIKSDKNASNSEESTKKDTEDIENGFQSDLNVPTMEPIFLKFSDYENLKGSYEAPDDRNIWLQRMWDKMAYIVEQALNNPEQNFMTQDGKLKAKSLSDIALILEKIQKAHEGKDDKKTGQLGEYIEMFNMMKQSNQDSESGDSNG